jgi:D-alanyl-D-alanine dipeptidase
MNDKLLIKIKEIDSTILQFSRYFSENNFLGKIVKGYSQEDILVTRETAIALKAIQDSLKPLGFSLLIYDGYRPKEAVQDFIDWAKSDDFSQKDYYYPTIFDKKELFEKGYIAEESGHMKGNTVDLTIIPLSQSIKSIEVKSRLLTNGDKILYLDDCSLDMGTSFDLFHPASHHDTNLIAQEYLDNRNFLRSIMIEHGFKEHQEEWWHYSYLN